MKCPSCSDVTLLLSARDGVEIDYCPQCRGVWLDRGELDKIIERAEPQRDPALAAVSTGREGSPARGDRDRGRDDDDDDDDDRRGPFGKKRKKKGFLSEMFEIGG